MTARSQHHPFVTLVSALAVILLLLTGVSLLVGALTSIACAVVLVWFGLALKRRLVGR